MHLDQFFISTLFFFLVATLYSSVGHAGGTGYLAIMSFMSLPAMIMKPAALVLNIIVSLIASVKYISKKCYHWNVFWPFALTSIPFSYLGGYINLNDYWFKLLAGLFLITSSVFMVARGYLTKNVTEIKKTPILTAMIIGALLGFFSGIIGVGGGIFLSPVIILLSWAKERETSGIAALFILVNSIAGLLGKLHGVGGIPVELLSFSVPSVVIGGFIGSTLGAHVMNKKTILTVLSVMVLSAGIKMLVSIL